MKRKVAVAGLAASVLTILALAGCGSREPDSGLVITQARDLGAFESINMKGAAGLQITVGAAQSVIVEAHEEETIARVKTEVRGGALHIRSDLQDWRIADGRPGVFLRIVVPELRSLRLEGGADVRLAGFDGGELYVSAEGAALIKARGRLDKLTVHMAGAGRADLTDLIANTAQVTVDGVGSVHVHSKESLDATMNGVGAILYAGDPRRINTRMNGLGVIRRQEDRDRDRDNVHPERGARDKQQPASDSTEVI